MTSLLLFVDNPEHASLNPELQDALTAEAFPGVYEALSDRLRNLTSLFAGEKYLYYSHYPNWNDGWDINSFRKRIQIGENLCERIQRAIEDASDEAPEGIIWISLNGSSLEPAHLEAIEATLSSTDLLVGESVDGEILVLGLGQGGIELALPEDFEAGAISEAARNAGLSVQHIVLPAPPKSLQDLSRLGIAAE